MQTVLTLCGFTVLLVVCSVNGMDTDNTKLDWENDNGYQLHDDLIAELHDYFPKYTRQLFYQTFEEQLQYSSHHWRLDMDYIVTDWNETLQTLTQHMELELEYSFKSNGYVRIAFKDDSTHAKNGFKHIPTLNFTVFGNIRTLEIHDYSSNNVTLIPQSLPLTLETLSIKNKNEAMQNPNTKQLGFDWRKWEYPKTMILLRFNGFTNVSVNNNVSRFIRDMCDNAHTLDNIKDIRFESCGLRGSLTIDCVLPPHLELLLFDNNAINGPFSIDLPLIFTQTQLDTLYLNGNPKLSQFDAKNPLLRVNGTQVTIGQHYSQPELKWKPALTNGRKGDTLTFVGVKRSQVSENGEH